MQPLGSCKNVKNHVDISIGLLENSYVLIIQHILHPPLVVLGAAPLPRLFLFLNNRLNPQPQSSWLTTSRRHS